MSKIPKLRFKDFNDDWKEKQYGDIYTFYSTNSFSRDNLNYENGEVFNIHYGDIHTKFSTMFSLNREEVPYINGDIDLSKIKSENYCQIGDLVIADASENYDDVGKTIEIIHLNNSKTLAGLHTFLARPNKHNMALGFAGYMLQSWRVRKQVMQIAQGTKVLGIATGRLSKINLNIPALLEQEKIASFFTSVDTKIEQLTKKEVLLKEYKKGVMQQIFSQKIRFKADDGSVFPEWEEKRMDKLTWYQEGPGVRRHQYTSSGVKLLNVGNLENNKLNLDKTDRFISNDEADGAYSHFLVDSGDILIACSGVSFNTYSEKICIAKDEHLPLCMNTSTMRFKPYDMLDKIYLFQFLKSVFFKHQVFRVLTGSAQFNFGPSHIKYFKVPLPCLKEQIKIAKFLSSIDTKIEQVQKQLDSTKEFKKALLQQMFV